MSSTLIEEKVIEFVSRWSKTLKSSVTLETSINYDLGIDGDDSFDFFKYFESEFHINLDTFYEEKYDLYFGQEGFSPMMELFSFLTRTRKSKKPEEFTVRMLLDLVLCSHVERNTK